LLDRAKALLDINKLPTQETILRRRASFEAYLNNSEANRALIMRYKEKSGASDLKVIVNIKSGWLYHYSKGAIAIAGLKPKWKKTWYMFDLADNSLLSYKQPINNTNKSIMAPKSRLSLSVARSVEDVNELKGQPYCIKLKKAGTDKPLYYAASSEQEKLEWLSLFEFSLVVKDLDAQTLKKYIKM